MTKNQWKAFCEYREKMKNCCENWLKFSNQLEYLQKKAAEIDTPPYPLETAVVYNRAYDEICEEDEINLIVIGDNPGKDEQLKKNNKYLVGQSGKIAAGFFAKNPELKTDFRKNVIIMNKTPVHTAKTKHLKFLIKNGGDEIKNLIEESQKLMAIMASNLHQRLIENCTPNSVVPQLWLIGYSELKTNGIFSLYRDSLKSSYTDDFAWDKVFVYQHFSMNRFLVDLKNFKKLNPEKNFSEALNDLGHLHRDEIF